MNSLLTHWHLLLVQLASRQAARMGSELANQRLLALTSFRDDFIAEWAASPATP